MQRSDGSWVSRFPDLAALPKDDQDLLAHRATSLALPAGVSVFAPGKAAESFLLVLDGTIRVQQVSASGRMIVLYRVVGGESCIMTTACLLSDESYTAEGITETAVTAIAIPKAAFEDVLARSPGFRRLVFTQYANRIADLIHVVEEVAFERMDKRLAQKLLIFADAAGAVSATHQHLATELGTAREVVGRQLKELERRGWLSVSRGRILLLDRQALRDLADQE